MAQPITPPIITCYSCDSTAIRLKKTIKDPNIYDRGHYVKYCEPCGAALTNEHRKVNGIVKKKVRMEQEKEDDERPLKISKTMQCCERLQEVECKIAKLEMALAELIQERQSILEDYITLA